MSKKFILREMSFLDQLRAKKSSLKSTVTNVTHADGSQEQILLVKTENGMEEIQKSQLQPKTFGFIVDTKPDTIPACIIPDFLYLGSQDSVILENVEKYRLTDILSIGIPAPACDIMFGDGNNSTVRNYFVELLDLPESSLEETIKNTNKIIESVRNKKGRILIHCNAGVSRSSSVCIAYLMENHKMSFESAFGTVKSKRECIRPNDGFLKQLKQFERLDSQ